MKLDRFFSILVLCCLLAVPAQAKEQMTWMLADDPPMAIPSSTGPGEGMQGAVAKFIVAHWPDADHHFQAASIKQIWDDIKAGKPVCAVLALQTPDRENLAYFSGVYPYPPEQFITRRKLVADIPRNAAGEVRLDDLLRARKLRGVLSEKASYGALDAILAARPADAKLDWNSQSDTLSAIAAGRTDWTLDFDSALPYGQRRDPSLSAIVSLPVEGNGAGELAGVACPRTVQGRQSIIRVDGILSDPAFVALAGAEAKRWQTARVTKQYTLEVEEFFRQRIRSSDPTKYEPAGTDTLLKDNKITWITLDLPPVYFPYGEHAGEGYGDQQVRFLIDALPDYDHRVIHVTSRRGRYEASKSDGFCTALVARTSESEKVLTFSAKTIRTPTARFVVKTARMGEFSPFLDADGAFDLGRFATESSRQLHGAYADSRVYLDSIDSFIHSTTRSIVLDPLSNEAQLLSLVHNDRVDFVFASAPEVRYQTQRLGAPNEFTVLPIAGAPDQIDLHIACSKGAIGTAVIAKIDALLKPEDRWLSYLQPMRPWWSQTEFSEATDLRH